MFPDSTKRIVQDSADAASGLRNTGELGQALFSSGFLSYRFTRHERVTKPVLVIAGVHDDAIGLAQQRALVSALRQGLISEYERGGHFPYLDEPERFTREVTEFLTGVATRSSVGRR